MRKNHHTHTPRCGHAVGEEWEYAEAAIEAGYDSLGFSDHTPWPGTISPGMRMTMQELPDYISAVRNLKERYGKKLDISCGLECEYYPEHMTWLKETIEEYSLDFIILGNHFDYVQNSNLYFGNCRTKDDIILYLKTTISAMTTGVYDWLAHPDLYLRDYDKFDDTCLKTVREICYASRNLGVPLEYNLLGLMSSREGRFSGLGYPYHKFWEIAAEENCSVIMNVDAHSPEHLKDTAIYDEGIKHIEKLGLKRLIYTKEGLVEAD
jgi:histidinol-phosphatase (PHP family)